MSMTREVKAEGRLLARRAHRLLWRADILMFSHPKESLDAYKQCLRECKRVVWNVGLGSLMELAYKLNPVRLIHAFSLSNRSEAYFKCNRYPKVARIVEKSVAFIDKYLVRHIVLDALNALKYGKALEPLGWQSRANLSFRATYRLMEHYPSVRRVRNLTWLLSQAAEGVARTTTYTSYMHLFHPPAEIRQRRLRFRHPGL